MGSGSEENTIGNHSDLELEFDFVSVLGLEVANLSLEELLDTLFVLSDITGVFPVDYVNAHACNLACSDPEFRTALRKATLLFCDGNGVKLGALILGESLKQRMTPPDWIDSFYTLCEQRNKKLFFVGEDSNLLNEFVNKVQQRHPDLAISGWHHGFFEFDGDEEVKLIQKIGHERPDFILTGMGMPKQELWAQRMVDRLPSTVILATGALFVWYAGIEERKQSWLTDHGFEWLNRYVQHPVRHFRRYILGNPLFLLRVVRQRFRGRSS